jgi:hypothetical protein
MREERERERERERKRRDLGDCYKGCLPHALDAADLKLTYYFS